ncbi:putative GPI-anchored cupredoxin [Ceratocystis fimbriata CBS 114723]|uniref:Putative GPI-anchored cupredoxin n=1 Tax=Ceratocystis fimbriata CBS 114723 TaxID=1035309 RepID=A0A2C5WTM3_9PEZI|nr:putative GPI-anchored cupredoxin [Ceratocystis fimbriata CBS 114723]
MRFAVTALLAATVVMASTGESDDDDYYPQTRTVWVGGDLQISPQKLWANVGDKIEFHFLSGLHSVVEANYYDPCQHNGGFASGHFSTDESDHQNSDVFVIEIVDDSPLWYYDGAGSECMDGAVGVINPPRDRSRTIEVFKRGASVESRSSNPIEHQGGSVITL